MSIVIDDEFLYVYMPQAEQEMLARIPPEHELHHHCKVAAAVFTVGISVTFGALMSVEACRTRIIEVITRVFEEFTSVRISGDGRMTDKVLRPIKPTHVPEGYLIAEEIPSETDYTIIYEAQNEKVLFYTQELLTASENIFDTEDAYAEKVMIGSQEVQVITKEKTKSCQIYWYDDLYFYWLDGKIELKDDILKMAESIIEQ